MNLRPAMTVPKSLTLVCSPPGKRQSKKYSLMVQRTSKKGMQSSQCQILLPMKRSNTCQCWFSCGTKTKVSTRSAMDARTTGKTMFFFNQQQKQNFSVTCLMHCKVAATRGMASLPCNISGLMATGKVSANSLKRSNCEATCLQQKYGDILEVLVRFGILYLEYPSLKHSHLVTTELCALEQLLIHL